jgi:hypothetical protein
MMEGIGEPPEEFRDHLCVGCGDPCDCEIRMERCRTCLMCQADHMFEGEDPGFGSPEEDWT